MRRAAAVMVAVGVIAVLAAPAMAARDRFPEFVYTAPETIREAQSILVGLRYLEQGSYKEGEWDRPSERAARGFQRDHFLRPNGRLDRDTLAVLLSHKPVSKK